MTSTGSDVTTPAVGQDAVAGTRRRLYRTAGIGGIGAALAWFVQPIVVSVSGDIVDGVDHAYVESHPFNGVIEATLFTAIGVGLLFLVTAVGRLARLSDRTVSTAAAVGHLLGIAGGIGWFFVAGLSIAPYTSVGFSLGEAAPERALQLGLYQLLGVVLIGMIMIVVVGFGGWLITVGTAGRRHGVVGWPLSIVALVAAAVSIGQLLVPFAPPWGSIAGLGFALVAGIAFLVKARRAG